MRLAEEDQTRLAHRKEKENSELSDASLSTFCANTQENLKDEKTELDQIVTDCNRDIASIGKYHYSLYNYITSNKLIILFVESGLKGFHARMDKRSAEQQQKKLSDENTLKMNRERQLELEEELRNLKSEEESLVNSIAIGEDTQKQLVVEKDSTQQEVEQWKGKIKELKKRTETALEIVRHMEGVYICMHVMMCACEYS